LVIVPNLAHTKKPLTDEDFTTFERIRSWDAVRSTLGRCSRVLVCALLFLPLASTTAYSPDEKQIPADTVITLQRGACEERCAVYKVVLFTPVPQSTDASLAPDVWRPIPFSIFRLNDAQSHEALKAAFLFPPARKSP
jgi:hypothetical protein